MLNEEGIKLAVNDGIYVDNYENNIGRNYINVTLSDTLKVYDTPFLDIKNASSSEVIYIPKEGYLLEPNKLYLGSTNEFTKTYGYVPLLSGLEELASLGVEIHITAGFGDNGFEGTWTLEIICANPTIIYPNMIIGRLYYCPLIGDDTILYRGKYFHQIKPTESRLSAEYQNLGGEVNVNK